MKKIKIGFKADGSVANIETPGVMKSIRIGRDAKGNIVDIELEWKDNAVDGCGGNCSCHDKKIEAKEKKVIPANKSIRIEDIPFQEIYNNVMFGDASMLNLITDTNHKEELQKKFAKKIIEDMAVGIGSIGDKGISGDFTIPPMFTIVGMDIK
ncbi:MAG: hypothetical protein ACRDCW_14530 [Sarcina sp.]